MNRSIAFFALGTLIGHAAVAATQPTELKIPGEKIHPESITSDAQGNVYIGSVGMRAVFKVPAGNDSAELWIKPSTEALQSILGVFADEKNKTLWVCSVAPNGTPPAEAKPSAVYAFDLKTGDHKDHYILPTNGSRCNDMAVDADGNLYVTDTPNMALHRLKRGAKELEMWTGGAFGARGDVLDGISVLKDKVYVNALSTNKIFSVEIGKQGVVGKVTEIILDHPIERPDGMRSFGKKSLLVVESGGKGRLSRVDIDGDKGKVTTLQEGFPGGPVAVTVVGETGYVIEAQFAAMRSIGPTQPFRAIGVHVGRP